MATQQTTALPKPSIKPRVISPSQPAGAVPAAVPAVAPKSASASATELTPAIAPEPKLAPMPTVTRTTVPASTATPPPATPPAPAPTNAPAQPLPIAPPKTPAALSPSSTQSLLSARPTALSDQQRKLLQQQQQQAATAQTVATTGQTQPKSRFTSIASNVLPDSATQNQDPAQPQSTQTQPTGVTSTAPAGYTPPVTHGTTGSGGTNSAVAPSPKFASPKKTWLKPALFIGGGVLLLIVVIFLLFRLIGGRGGSTTPTDSSGNPSDSGGTTTPAKQIRLTYWGLWEPTEVMEPVFDQFEKDNPGVTVDYIKQSSKSYRERLVAAIDSGNGPDIFRFHGSWTPMLSSVLAPLPASVYTTTTFTQAFYPVAAEQLQSKGQPVGIPLMYDGLVLFINSDSLQTANEQPPQTWAELKTLAARLTVRSSGAVERGGLAIGNATNVEHFSDILALLMLQNGADLTQPNSPEGRDALLFYTSFMQGGAPVWSDKLPNSTVAFARGDVAMMFAPSWRAHEIAALNPQLNFTAVPVPQLADEKIAWASYWAEGVNSKSTQKDLAWKLLSYLSQPETLKQLYAAQSQDRLFGELYPRPELANELATNEIAVAVLEDASVAQGGFMSSATHDAGINDQIIQYYQEGITSILTGTDIETALETIDTGVTQVLRQYGAN